MITRRIMITTIMTVEITARAISARKMSAMIMDTRIMTSRMMTAWIMIQLLLLVSWKVHHLNSNKKRDQEMSWRIQDYLMHASMVSVLSLAEPALNTVIPLNAL